MPLAGLLRAPSGPPQATRWVAAARHTGDSRDLERAIARVWGAVGQAAGTSGEAHSTLAASHAADSGTSWGDTAC